MDNGMITFTTNQEKYKNQLKEHSKFQQKDAAFSSEQFLDQLSSEQDFMQEYDGQGYRVNFETAEELEQSQKILTSDEELEAYYKEKDPEMLEGLRSKSSINVVGKKSEKKKLRKKYLEAHSDEVMEKNVVKQKYIEVAKDGWTIEEVQEKMKEDDVNAIMYSFKLQNKTPKELKKLQKKVEGLSYSRRKQLLSMTDKSVADADLDGVDTEEVRQAQERVAKSHVSTADDGSYRIYRQARQFDADHPLPDNTAEVVKNASFKVGSEFLERTAKGYMKEVKFVTKDGKKVPASPEYEENMKYNQKFIDSLFSDDESKWDFRFSEMEKMLDKMWDDYKKIVKDIFDGKFDFNNTDIDLMTLYDNGRKHLCFSGLATERTSLFRSKYYKSLSEERQKELDVKNETLTMVLRLLELKIADKGINPTGYKFQSEHGTRVTSKTQLEPLTMGVMLSKDAAQKYL